MLTGIDISHHNKNMKDLRDILKYSFVIMKASEGYSFRDNAVSLYMNVIANSYKKPVVGFYHFARPEINNNPWDEAINFIEAVTPYLSYNPLLALDVEAGALNYPDLDNWCQEWLSIVENILGKKPMIYCSAAETRRFKKCCEYGAGLWVAKWSDKISKSDIKPWPFWAIWQNSASGICSGVRIDTDVFNGTIEQLLKYCEVNDGAENNSAPDYSGDRSIIPTGKHRRVKKDK